MEYVRDNRVSTLRGIMENLMGMGDLQDGKPFVEEKRKNVILENRLLSANDTIPQDELTLKTLRGEAVTVEIDGAPYETRCRSILAGSDTLTWDGNTNGLASVDLGDGIILYKVSDSTPTLSEAQKGGKLSVGSDSSAFTNEQIMPASEAVYCIGNADFILVVLEDDAELMGALTISEKGVYFGIPDGMHISSLTINGYTGFVEEIHYIGNGIAFDDYGGKDNGLPFTIYSGGSTTRVNYYGDLIGSSHNVEVSTKLTLTAPLLTSPNGTKYKLTVSDDGTISVTKV